VGRGTGHKPAWYDVIPEQQAKFDALVQDAIESLPARTARAG